MLVMPPSNSTSMNRMSASGNNGLIGFLLIIPITLASTSRISSRLRALIVFKG